MKSFTAYGHIQGNTRFILWKTWSFLFYKENYNATTGEGCDVDNAGLFIKASSSFWILQFQQIHGIIGAL